MSEPRANLRGFKKSYELLMVALIIIGVIVAIVIPGINTRKKMLASALNAVRAEHPEAERVVNLKSRFVTLEYRTVTVRNKDGSESTYVLNAR